MKNFLLSALLLLAHFFAYSQIGGGHTFSAMLSSDGRVFTFGNNTKGELGSNSALNYATSPQEVQGLPRITSIDAGSGSHMLALACDSTIWSWGMASCGQLGTSSIAATCSTNVISASPVRVERGEQLSINGSAYLSKVVYISSGNEQSYAVLANGLVMAWGKNNYGQLGNGTTVNSNTPVFVMTSPGVRLTNVVAVDAGDEQCYALTADGAVWSWGNNNNMALGQTMDSPYYEVYAAQVLKTGSNTPLKNIAAIAAGDNHGLAIDSSGHVWSWGGNWGYGQLGNATNAPTLAGQVVDIGVTNSSGPFLSNVISIAAGNSFSLAVLSDGRVVSWGSNNFSGYDICSFSDSQASGQLGVGMSASSSCMSSSTEYTSSPVVVLTAPGTPLQNIVSVHRGDAWAFAITSSGNIYNWGWNREGQLGNGITSNSNYAKIFAQPSGVVVAYSCPMVDLGPDASICPGSGKTLKAGKAMSSYTYTWSYATSKNGPFSTVAGPTTGTAGANYTTTEFGYYKVQVSDTRSILGCMPCKTSFDTVYISQLPLPYTANNSTYCGDSATFSVTGTGAYNWYDSYSGGTKINTSTHNSIKVPLTQAHQVNSTTYELFVEDIANTSFNIAPTPSCAGSISNGSSSPVMFQAYSNFTLDSVKFIQPASTTSNYSVQIFSNNPTGGPYCSNCCGGAPCNTDGPSLTPLATSPVISLPVVSVNTIRSIPVNINITGSPAGTKYWIVLNGYGQVFNCVPSPGFPFTDDVANPTIKIVKALYNNATTSNYGTMYGWHISKGSYNPCSRIPVRSVAYCAPGCSNKPSSVSINPMSSLTLCDNVVGDSVILNTTVSPANPPSGVYQYRWFKNGVLINGAISPSYLAKVSGGSATYSVKVNNSTDSDTSCYRSAGVGVVVRNVPKAYASSPHQVISYATTVLYGNSPSSGTGTWSLQSGSAIIERPFDYTSGLTLDLGVSVFRWTITIPGCPSNYDEVTVERVICNNTPDSVGITLSGPLTMCSNSLTDSLIITSTVYPVNPVAEPYQYAWYKDGVLINGATSPSYVVKPAGVSAYYYVMVAASTDNIVACYSGSTGIDVTILEVPTAQANYDQQTIFPDAQMNANYPYPGTGNWTLQSGSATIDNPSDPATTLSSISLGISVLRWTITVPGCTPTYDEVIVERTLCNNKPDSITITPSGSLIMCSNSVSDSVILNTNVYNTNPPLGSYFYSWYKDGTPVSGITTTSSYLVKSEEGSANYSVAVIATSDYDITSCYVYADTNVYILDVPLANAGNDQLTSNSAIQMQGSNPYSAVGNWTLQSGLAIIDNPSDPATTLSSVSLGVSVLRWTLTVPGCTPEYDEVTIERGQAPSVPAISGPNNIPYGQPLTFSVPLDPTLNYTWNISASGTILSGQNSNTVSVIFNDSGLPQADSLSVTVTNTFGASNSSKMLFGLATGISSSNFNNQFTFSPNPFSSEGIITNTLASGILTVSITDLMGKEIFRSDYPAGMTISIGKDLKNGVYLLTILGPESKMTSRIIKID